MDRRKRAAAIPRLRGPTRRKAARRRKSGRSVRNDKVGGGREVREEKETKSTDPSRLRASTSVCAAEGTETAEMKLRWVDRGSQTKSGEEKGGDGDGMEDAGGVGGA
jgi:hypothetical protein